MAKTGPTERERLAAHFTETSPLRVLVVTMSDRAHAGVYEDRSGPLLAEHVEAFCTERDMGLDLERRVLPDDADGLYETIIQACEAGAHVVFTTGGTGVGPRDNTTEVILDLAEKEIPGIMELIRMKYGADKPCALLSRTVAAVRGGTLLYALPGSTKGVTEYMTEIAKTLQHLLVVLHELDPHE
jgi:molybdenum cofactor synthesis domain-containing protein